MYLPVFYGYEIKSAPVPWYGPAESGTPCSSDVNVISLEPACPSIAVLRGAPFAVIWARMLLDSDIDSVPSNRRVNFIPVVHLTLTLADFLVPAALVT